jgi:hypothetical protein
MSDAAQSDPSVATMAAFALTLRMHVFEAFGIPSSSMVPALVIASASSPVAQASRIS